MKKIVVITGLILIIHFINGINLTNGAGDIKAHDFQGSAADRSQITDPNMNENLQTGGFSKHSISKLSRVINYPEGFRYSLEHLWVCAKGDYCEIGITDYLQENLGDIVFVETYSPGDWLVEGEEFGLIEAVMRVYPLSMPISGLILEVNPILDDSPDLLNSNPHMIPILKVKIADRLDFDKLFTAKEYKYFISDM